MPKLTFNPINGEFDYYETGSANPYITEGTDGITYFRMESPDDGSLWDAYIDATGAWVITAAAANSGSPIGLLLTLTYP